MDAMSVRVVESVVRAAARDAECKGDSSRGRQEEAISRADDLLLRSSLVSLPLA